MPLGCQGFDPLLRKSCQLTAVRTREQQSCLHLAKALEMKNLYGCIWIVSPSTVVTAADPPHFHVKKWIRIVYPRPQAHWCLAFGAAVDLYCTVMWPAGPGTSGNQEVDHFD